MGIQRGSLLSRSHGRSAFTILMSTCLSCVLAYLYRFFLGDLGFQFLDFFLKYLDLEIQFVFSLF